VSRRKTEYIASEYYRTQFKSEKMEAKVGFNIKKMFNPDELYKDRESQLRTIEKTFQLTQHLPSKHYSKPGVTANNFCNIYPDFRMWKFPFAQVCLLYIILYIISSILSCMYIYYII